MVTGAHALVGPATEQETLAAFTHPDAGPKLLENYKFLVSAVTSMQEQIFAQQKSIELLCQQLGKQFGLPCLTKFKAGATPLTDGRDFPGPKDASPREMTYDEKYVLSYYMYPKGMCNMTYARNVSKILSPKDWYKPSYNPHPRLDLASSAQLWKIWYLTFEHYGIQNLAGVMTPQELKDSENPHAKKQQAHEQPLNHASYSTAVAAATAHAAASMSAEAEYQGKKRRIEARLEADGTVAASSPCAYEGESSNAEVSHSYLFGQPSNAASDVEDDLAVLRSARGSATSPSLRCYPDA